jgi:hypothetical protein
VTDDMAGGVRIMVGLEKKNKKKIKPMLWHFHLNVPFFSFFF